MLLFCRVCFPPDRCCRLACLRPLTSIILALPLLLVAELLLRQEGEAQARRRLPTQQQAAARKAPAAARPPSKDEGKGEAQVLMGPFLRDLTLSEVTVVFRTNRKARAAVLYRIPGEQDIRLETPEPSVHHEFTLKSLAPDRIYVYRIVVEGKEIPGGSFTTPPGPHTPVIIGVYGDTRKYEKPHAEVCSALVRRSVDLLIHTGDLVHNGYWEADWIRFFEIEKELLRSTPIYPVIGNHDNRGQQGKWWFETLFGANAATRSIDYGPVHLVILNSEGDMAKQARWLEEDLQRLRRDKPEIHYVLAFIHHGPYGTGRFGGSRKVARFVTPLLRRYGPAIFFSGHEHNYERGEVDGLPFYVTGGGGAVLEWRKCRGPCPSWSRIWLSIYHYLIVEASPAGLKICTHYPSGLEVEPCISYPAPVREVPGQPPATAPSPDDPTGGPAPDEEHAGQQPQPRGGPGGDAAEEAEAVPEEEEGRPPEDGEGGEVEGDQVGHEGADRLVPTVEEVRSPRPTTEPAPPVPQGSTSKP